jgi:hypothetical protein
MENVLHFTECARQAITEEVLDAFNAIPKRGAETGGILLGSRSGERLEVDDFLPIPCEHRFGPSFRLSPRDRQGLAELLSRSPEKNLGLCRSQTGGDTSLDEQDVKLMNAYFPDPGALMLLLRPNRRQTIEGRVFVQSFGGLTEVSARNPWSGALAEIAPPKPVAPVQSPVLAEDSAPAAQNRPWRLAVAAVMVGIVLGAGAYRYLGPRPPPPKPAPPPIAAVPQAPPASPSPMPPDPADPSHSADRVIQEPPEEQVRASLNRWERAMRSGNSREIAACYMKQSRPAGAGRSSRPAILRISGLTITLVSPLHAVATFRRHWQTAPPRAYAGEEQERMTLYKVGTSWKIAGEEARTVWTQAVN